MSRTLTGKALLLSIGALLQKASTFLLIIYLVRVVEKTEYGTYQQLIYSAGILYGLFASGLAVSLYYFIPRLTNDKKTRFVIQTIVIMASLGLMSALVMYNSRIFIGEYIENNLLSDMLKYYSIYVFFWISSDYFLHFLNSYDQHARSMVFAALESVSNALAILIPLSMGWQLIESIQVLAIVSGIRYFIYVFFTLYFIKASRNLSFLNPKEQLQYSFPLLASGWADLLGGYLDKVIVSIMYPPSILAIYAIGTIKLPLWDIVAKPINIVLRVKFAELIAENKENEVEPIWREAVRKQSMLVLPIIVLLWVISEHLFPVLFTDAYSESVNIFRIYLLDKPFLVLSFSVFPLSMGRPDFLFKGSILFVISNIILMSMLVKPLGIYGPIVSLVVSQYIHYLFYVYMINKHLKIKPSVLFQKSILLKVVFANLVPAAIIFTLGKMIDDHIVSIIVSCVIYVVVYFFILRMLGVLLNNDIKLLVRKLPLVNRYIKIK
jgi:O-antigen/teichoic acid export membrane protein